MLLVGMLATAVAFFSPGAQAQVTGASCSGAATSSLSMFSGERFAQTFTAAATGDAYLGFAAIDNSAPGGDFQMQVLAVDASGTPVNGILGMATIPAASVLSGSNLTRGAFSPRPRVVQGQQYALVITRLEGDFKVRDRGGNPCPGREFTSSSQTGPWFQEDPDFDLVFGLTVIPSNKFTIGKLKGKKLHLNLESLGSVEVVDAKAAAGKPARGPRMLKGTGPLPRGPGEVTVPLRLTKVAKRILEEEGTVTVRPLVSFTPFHAPPFVETNRLRAKRKLR